MEPNLRMYHPFGNQRTFGMRNLNDRSKSPNTTAYSPMLRKISNIFRLDTEKTEVKEIIRTSSQNFLRANLIDMQRRSGVGIGLNAAMACDDVDPNVSLGRESFIVRRTISKQIWNSLKKSPQAQNLTIRPDPSEDRVYDIESSNFELYPEDQDDPSLNLENESIASETNEPLTSVFTNPKYGSVQREPIPPIGNENLVTEQQNESRQEILMNASERHLYEIQVTPNCLRLVKSLQEAKVTLETSNSVDTESSFQVILPPGISDSRISVHESEMSLEAGLSEDEENVEHELNPLETAREYNIRLQRRQVCKERVVLPKKTIETINICSRNEENAGVVTNIPRDSWIAFPLRMLPGKMVHFGALMLPSFLLVITAFGIFIVTGWIKKVAKRTIYG